MDAKPGRSPEPVRQRLRDLSDRTYGSQAIRLRERPIPWAYRVFFRQIGLDPDRTRTPVEQLTLDRLHDGGFRSHGLPADALKVAIVETGVALRAFDAEGIEGRLCIRDTAPGESMAGQGAEMAKGTLAIADEARPVGLLFGPSAEGLAVEKRHPPHRRCRGAGQGRAPDRSRGGAVDRRGDPGGGVTTISVMPRLLDQTLHGPDVAVDEREARLQLRRQIARLEASWARSSARPSVTPRCRTGSIRSPPHPASSISATSR